MITIPLVALIGLIQATLTSQLRLFDVSPDLVLVVVITWVIIRDQPEGLLAAVIGGAAVAALSGGPRVLIVTLFMLCSLLAGYAHRHLPRLAGIIPYLAVLGATLLYKGILIFWLQTTTQRAFLPGLVVQVLGPALLYNVVTMAIIYELAVRLDKRLGPPTVDWQ